MSSQLPAQPEFNPYSTPAVDTSQNIPFSEMQLGQYATVRTGLKLIYYSIAAVAIIAIVITFVGLASAGFMAQSVNAGVGAAELGFAGVLFAGGTGIFIAGITSIIGFCMCATCPNPNEKTLAIVSIVAFFISFGVSILSGILEAAGAGLSTIVALPIVALPIVSNIAQIVFMVTFCLLLKRIGSNISSAPLERRSKSALVWFGLLVSTMVVGFIAMVVILPFAPDRDVFAIGAVIPGLAIIVLGLGTLFQSLAMLRLGIVELTPKHD